MAEATESTVGVAPEKGKFRFQNQRALVTYKTHVNKEAYKIWAKAELGCTEVHVAHETSEKETPYDHTHVLLEWEKAFQTRDCRRFDFDGIHPNISPIRSREHLANACRYMCKQDHSCDELLERRGSAFSKRIWSCKSLTEALEQVEKPSDVIGVKAMFDNRPREEDYRERLDHPRVWQQQIMDMIKGPADDRTIVWVMDPAGGAGKSRLCRYLEDNHEAIVLTGISNARDVAQILRGRLDRGESPRVIIADLSRSYESRDIYNTLEMLKNGRMDSPKYEGTSLRWRPGHVIVMANFGPDAAKMTWDRWRIVDLGQARARGEVEDTGATTAPAAT